MEITIITRIIQSIIITGAMVTRGYTKGSLNKSGSIAASIVGIIIGMTGMKLLVVLGVFFVSSSFFTKYKADVKRKIEDDFKEGGERNWIQVFSNGFAGTLTCCIILYSVGVRDIYFDFIHHHWESSLLAAYIAHFACCNGDTWASELGVLSKTKPILITDLRTVPTGTNGGITQVGCGVSLLGGLAIGLSYYLANIVFCDISSQPPQHAVILLGAISGSFGSLVDSILGATLQYSGWDTKKQKVVAAPGPNVKHICGINLLDNHQVNLISSCLTAIMMGVISESIFSLI